MDCSVLLAVGHPFSGKAFYYAQELSDSHVRVSATEIYRKDRSANLRIIIQRVVTELKKGYKVFVDDDNLLQRPTRLSYVAGISKKIPRCKFACVQFVPQHGTIQLCFSQEWNLAQHTLANFDRLSSVSDAGGHVAAHFPGVVEVSDSYLSAMQEVPLDWDKYDTVTIQTPFFCVTPYKFTCQVLLIQWEGMLEAGGSGKRLRQGVTSTLQKWCSSNPDGHVVIICKGGASMREEVSDLLATVIDQVITLDALHFVIADDCNTNGFFPAYCLMAWLQYLFNGSLQHKCSLYIFHSKHQRTCAEALGIKNISASKVFCQPHTVNAVHFSEHEVSSHLQAICFVRPSCTQPLTPEGSKATSENSTPRPRNMPLFCLASILEASSTYNCAHAKYDPTTSTYSVECSSSASTTKEVSALASNGRVLGMIYKVTTTLERFQQFRLETVSRVKVLFTTKTASVDTAKEVSESMARGEGDILESTCSCCAGERGIRCKHTVALLLAHMESTRAVLDDGHTSEETNRRDFTVSLSSRSLPEWIVETSQVGGSAADAISDTMRKIPKQDTRPPADWQSEFRLTERSLLKTALEVLQNRSTAGADSKLLTVCTEGSKSISFGGIRDLSVKKKRGQDGIEITAGSALPFDGSVDSGTSTAEARIHDSVPSFVRQEAMLGAIRNVTTCGLLNSTVPKVENSSANSDNSSVSIRENKPKATSVLDELFM